jgi:hypothetical protein
MNKTNQGLLLAFSKGYRVSDDGRVLTPRGKIRKLFDNGRRYLYFSIRDKERNGYFVYVHRLQAFQKFGDKLFEDGVEVRHLNGDSYDNSTKNIAIGSHSDNALDVPARKRVCKGRHAASFLRKLSNEQVCRIRSSYAAGETIPSLCKRYNVNHGTIWHIVHSKTYSEVV